MLSVAGSQPDVQLISESSASRGSSNSCATCCPSCSNERHESHFVRGSTSTSFEHLLCAGSLTLKLLSGGCICSHQHAEDGFHALPDIDSLRPYLAMQDVELLNALSFLLRHRFALATYMTTPSTMGIILRVYLIPYDLPGSQGALRTRDEDRVMKPARSHLRKVLSRVSKKQSSWNGEDECFDLSPLEECFLPPNQDERSLSQIFNDLTTTNHGSNLPEIPRLRTSLYEYQKESVATMLSMEMSNRITDDPLYIPTTGMNGKPFYFQPTTMELLLHCPRSYQARGGVLCEELGTGKTVMTLALIMATLDVLPDPPEHDGAEVLTPLAFRHFPQKYYSEFRKLALTKEKLGTFGANEKNQPVPSLVEILCHYVRKNPSSVNLRVIEDTPLWDHVRKNAPFFFHFDQDYSRQTSPRRRKSIPPQITYLTTATLIVVPATLQTQWYSEILKHCPSSIRTLVVKSRKDIPTPLTLASDYDIVLTTYNLISFEATDSKDLSALDTGYNCHCPEFATVRVPDCSCQSPESVSPFLQVRWKRLIRDEGHNAASQTTELNHFLRIIGAERRWIVTGTPTTNLLGLNFGSITDDDPGVEEVDHQEASYEFPLVYNLYDLESEGRLSERAENVREISEDDLGELPYPRHIWSRADRTDLRKLGSMLSNFLGVLPFAVDPDSFSNLLVNGLMDENGPLPGTTRVLEQVMAANMVRHRVSDVERYVRLPPLNEEVILLDLEEYGLMTYNALLSFVVVNAVDSERRDMDYLFHASKAALLASTMENLSHSLFWRFDENALDYELPDNIHRAENAIDHARERGQPDEDILLVKKAISHLQKALGNQQFRDMQHGLEVPYFIHYAPQRVRQTWGLVHEPDYARDESVPFLVYPSYALELRSFVLRRPFMSEEWLAMRAGLVRAKNSALAAFVEARKSKSEKRMDGKGSSEKRRRRGEVQIDRARLDTARRTATVDSIEKLQELHEEFRKAQERLQAEASGDEVGHLSTISSLGSSPTRKVGTAEFSVVSEQMERPIRGSPYARMRIGNSTSSKLNYILEEVHKYSETEKFLIFSSQPFNLVHISEGLDLMGVKYLHFMKEATEVRGKGPQRDQWLTTFETSETYRVFLMELKYGARGLNIVSASRVIFCEPVWHADVESQAIKRVHRIGQTRPVTVKTLAIRSTFEGYMIQRRRDFKGAGSKLPGLTEEWGVRNYLQNPVFLEAPPQNTVNLDFPLLHVPRSDASVSEDGSGEVEAVLEQPGVVPMGYSALASGERMDVDQLDPYETLSPKRRKVRFG